MTPLTPILDHGRRRQRSASARAFLLVAFALLAALAGSSYAASITINSATDIEFGQGAENVVACDASTRVRLINERVGTQFLLSVVTIDQLARSCLGAHLRLTLFDGGGAVLDTIDWHLAPDPGGTELVATAYASGLNNGVAPRLLGLSSAFFYPSGNGLAAGIAATEIADLTLETSGRAF